MDSLLKRIRKLKIREGSRDPQKWREDAQNLILLMNYLRLLQPLGGLLKTLRDKDQATYRLFANLLAFVFNGLTRARNAELEAWDDGKDGIEESKEPKESEEQKDKEKKGLSVAEFKVCIALIQSICVPLHI